VPEMADRTRGGRTLTCRAILALAAALLAAGCTASAATAPIASPSPSAAASAAVPSSEPTASPTPAETASPSPRPSIPDGTAPQAAVTIHELVLDPVTDSAATPRTIEFASDGPGHVSVQVVSATTISSTKLCLSADGAEPVCRTGVAPAFPDEATTGAHVNWTLTVASVDESASTIDVAIGWPTTAPSVKLTDGRFQGSPNTDALRSFSTTFTPRSAGAAGLEASWKPGPATATLTLVQEQAPGGAAVDRVAFPSGVSIPSWSHAVAKGVAYLVTLMNTGADAGRTSLTVTLTFP
jgi:hypothetical protein